MNLKTALLKLKTEASERRDAEAINLSNTDRHRDGFKKGYDSRQKEIDVLISVIEKQAEALKGAMQSIENYCNANRVWQIDKNSILYQGSNEQQFLDTFKCGIQAQAEVLALLSGREGDK